MVIFVVVTQCQQEAISREEGLWLSDSADVVHGGGARWFTGRSVRPVFFTISLLGGIVGKKQTGSRARLPPRLHHVKIPLPSKKTTLVFKHAPLKETLRVQTTAARS